MSIDLAEHRAKGMDGIFTLEVGWARRAPSAAGKGSSIQMQVPDTQHTLPEIGSAALQIRVSKADLESIPFDRRYHARAAP
jgi:hypothetical protein